MSDEPRKDPGDIRLQQFSLKESAYERPNQNWVCGRLCAGAPCAVGPDAKGRCVATAECRPVKKGDQWLCTRRDAAAAPYPCGEGPLPDGSCAHPIAKCSPVRSICAKRRKCVLAAFAMSVGLLCLFLFGPENSAFVTPGELTDAHAQILGADRASNCQACHIAGQGRATNWLRLSLVPAVGAVQNGKCLVCHGAELGNDAALPHSLPAGTLQRISAAARATGPRTTLQALALFAPSVPETLHGEIACATCHQEHGGRHENIEVMADMTCQVCHKAQFESFTRGHPEFKAVQNNRAGIVFDHALHQPRMPEGKLDCALCHRPDPVGRTMQFTGFQQACAGCHDQGKLDHHGDQIRNDVRIILQLPTMTLDQAGNWPDSSVAPGDTLTPMLQFLIAGDDDPASLQALKSLAADTVANGSVDDWDADAKTKAQLATAIKRVAGELSLSDEPSPRSSNRELMRARIARAAGLPAASPAVTELLDQLMADQDITKAWRQHALPRLADDLAGTLQPTTPDADNESAPKMPWKPPSDASGWFIDPDAVSVNYRPSHADAFDKSWIDVLAASARPAPASKIIATMPNSDFLAALRIQLLAQHGDSCVKCHAMQPQNDSYFVNWYAAGRATRDAGFFKFDHKPHLILFPSDEQCSICHKLETGSPSPAPSPVDALLFPVATSNHGLAAHNKDECVGCHNPTGAADACLTCHDYHMTK